MSWLLPPHRPVPSRPRGIRLLLLALAWGSMPAAQAAPPLLVYAEDAPPLSVVDARPMSGPVIEAVRAILKQAGQDAEIQNIPWARAYMNGLKRPNTALFAVARVPAREAQFLWIGELYRNQTYVYRLASREDIPYAPLKALSAYRVAIVRGTSLADRLQRLGFAADKIQQVTTARQRIPLLISGRVDLMTFNSAAIDYYLAQYSQSVRVVPVAPAHDELLHQYLVMSKGSDAELVQALASAYRELRGSGRFQPIDTIAKR